MSEVHMDSEIRRLLGALGAVVKAGVTLHWKDAEDLADAITKLRADNRCLQGQLEAAKSVDQNFRIDLTTLRAENERLRVMLGRMLKFYDSLETPHAPGEAELLDTIQHGLQNKKAPANPTP